MKPDINHLKEIVENYSKVKILVIGDIMLDHFIRGKVHRISPEAPVPIVHVTNESLMPGGAANVAMNLRALNSETGIIGTIGKDMNGRHLKLLLRKSKINVMGVHSLPNILTTKKTRIIAHSQQIVRFDYETSKDISGENEQHIIEIIKKTVPLYNAVIIEDYGKGIITQSIVDTIITSALEHNTYIAFDPKIGHEINCSGINLCTPNTEEANHLAKSLKRNIGKIPENGDKLRKLLGLKELLVTLGEDGMALFSENSKPYKISAKAREVFDVSGAGDTVISVYTASIVAGATPYEAAYLANIAAGIVVGKLGTATVSPSEINDSLNSEK